ncbi:hypothetical protein [Spiroplasma cantharicola]|uniref:Transmembrane protein n=1 Tax=Spiroplasma cantharicola TaxID=362837 RepID=A0A0M4JJE8_9MOLU|nr:hypothetical protein [Spiroplasma cantharicola]ALD66299.1 hypothetical protein SCANT_v1c03890 [Spiroplasma cantharicola]
MLKRKYRNIKGYYTYNLITGIVAFLFSFLTLFSKYIISLNFKDENKTEVIVYNSFGKYLMGAYHTESIDIIFNTNIALLKIMSISLTSIFIIFTAIFFINKSIKKPFFTLKKLNNIYVFLTIINLISIIIIKSIMISQFISINKTLNNHILITNIPDYLSANMDLTMFITMSVVSIIITLSACLFNISVLKILNGSFKKENDKNKIN